MCCESDQLHTQTQIHMYIHTDRQADIHTRTCMHTNKQTNTQTNTHTNTHTQFVVNNIIIVTLFYYSSCTIGETPEYNSLCWNDHRVC